MREGRPQPRRIGPHPYETPASQPGDQPSSQVAEQPYDQVAGQAEGQQDAQPDVQVSGQPDDQQTGPGEESSQGPGGEDARWRSALPATSASSSSARPAAARRRARPRPADFKDEQLVNFTTRLPKSLPKALRMWAVENDSTIEAFMLEAVLDRLARER